MKSKIEAKFEGFVRGVGKLVIFFEKLEEFKTSDSKLLWYSVRCFKGDRVIGDANVRLECYGKKRCIVVIDTLSVEIRRKNIGRLMITLIANYFEKPLVALIPLAEAGPFYEKLGFIDHRKVKGWLRRLLDERYPQEISKLVLEDPSKLVTKNLRINIEKRIFEVF